MQASFLIWTAAYPQARYSKNPFDELFFNKEEPATTCQRLKDYKIAKLQDYSRHEFHELH